MERTDVGMASDVVGLAIELGTSPVTELIEASNAASSVLVPTTDADEDAGDVENAWCSESALLGADETNEGQAGVFGFRVDSVEECGTTCREVTATLVNRQEKTAHDVEIEVEVFADGERIWHDIGQLDHLEPWESITEQITIEVHASGGMKVKNNDGYVTVRTTIRSDDACDRYVRHRRVI